MDNDRGHKYQNGEIFLQRCSHILLTIKQLHVISFVMCFV